MARVFLSLGSNKGDRVSNIQQAVTLLGINEKIKIIKSSSLYETQPWKNIEQDWYNNACVALECELEPIELLKYCQSIETKLGRIRNPFKKWEDRTIDIDILMYDDKIISAKDTLIIPHPYLHLRAFVLVPMLEVKADLIHPVYKKTISELYDDLTDPEDVFLYGTVIPNK